MIVLDNISKSYLGQSIIHKFSYAFPDTGLILLFGESGCGKTTLLNLIAGIISPDEGEVIADSETYGYITQDSHFIDYLTVLENLEISSAMEQKDKLKESLMSFGLWEERNQYPHTLSGGQRQRLAILQMVLSNKKVLLLDEPTAALDAANKKLVFELLSKLKATHLIIFSSHDCIAKEYADECIDFHHLQSNRNKSDTSVLSAKKGKHTEQVRCENHKLGPYMKKYYSYPYREKKSSYFLFLVLVLSFLCIGLVDLPQNKVDSNVKYRYQLNQLTLVGESKGKGIGDEIESDLIYHLSVPAGNEGVDGSSVDVSYNMSAKTLPFHAEAFKLSDRLSYGSYFTKPEQILLSYEAASKMGNPEELIGKTMNVELFDHAYDLEIVGVFHRFNKFEQQYMRASQAYEEEDEDGIYINGEFTKRYVSDKKFSILGKRTYVLYYKDYDSAKRNYEMLKGEGYEVRPVDAWIDNGILSIFGAMCTVLLPLVSVIMVATILLYFQTNKVEMTYQRHIFSTYNYLGYSLKEIRRCWIKSSIKRIVRLAFSAVLTAGIIMVIINVLNERFVMIPFQLFSINLALIGITMVGLCIVTWIVSYVTIRQIKIQGYYEVLLENRDLF